MVRLVPLSTNPKLYLAMAEDYVNTLCKYDDEIRWDEAAARSWMWCGDFIVDDAAVKGFVIYEDVAFSYGEPGALYIAEMYISPENRGMGCGFEAIRVLTEPVRKDVFLYVLRRNLAGAAFWDAVEKRLGWSRIIRPEIREERGCELRVYKMRRGSDDRGCS